MRTEIGKWGNSLAVRIPRDAAAKAGVKEGDEVELVARGGKLEVRPVRRRFSLQELVDGITKGNRHDATDWGAPAGKETW